MAGQEANRYRLRDGRDILIRPARVEDAEQLLNHARIIIAEDLYNITTLEEFKQTVEEERKWISKHISERGYALLVAELDGAIVGLIGFENSSRRRLAHRGTLHMSVHPAHRRKGVGTALLKSLLAWAASNPVIEKVKLRVFASNTPAVRLYQKMGFAEEGRRMKEVKLGPGRYADEILMYKFVKDLR